MAFFTDSLIEEEMSLELDAVKRGVQRYRKLVKEAIHRGDGASLKPAERLLVHWFDAFVAAIGNEKREIAAGKPGTARACYGPYMHMLDSDRMALIAMHEAMGALMAEPDGAKSTGLCIGIGRAVNAEFNIERMKDNEDAWEEVVHTNRNRLVPLLVNRVASHHYEDGKWGVGVQAHLGAALMSLLLTVASIDDLDKPIRPAIEKFTAPGKKRFATCFRLSSDARKLIEDGHQLRQHMRPRYLPMIVPPVAWSDKDHGGYLKLKCELVKVTHLSTRSGDGGQRAREKGDLSTIHEGINALSSTAMRINPAILVVANELWESGGGVAGLPNKTDKEIPPVPADFDTNDESKRNWKYQAVQIRRANAQSMSDRINTSYALNIANSFVDRERLFFPHQLDFRGRAYPIPLYLNHQGNDLSRGLLMFAHGQRLTDRGLFWLKVHIANCCGIDKIPFGERAGWTEANHDVLAGWASDPLENTGWMETDKPWQALAAVMSLASGGDCHIPIQKDGSCNGLQHYAALGLDVQGGTAVNLVPADQPADVYAAVADKVRIQVQLDADSSEIAKLLEGHITRKTVKRPVMTSVYGVTMVGARQQVYEELAEGGFPKDHLYEASTYLSRATLDAVKTVCVGAGRIMAWLSTCAKIIAKTDRSVAWETPLGLPLEQPYRKPRQRKIKTILHEMWTNLSDEDSQILRRKQTNAFAPNFIHSLDSSHMLCTAIACRDAGIDFAGVHDSFWTLPNDVDTMDLILREQFVALHENDILGELRQSFVDRYQLEFPDPPLRGQLNLFDVKQSSYFFA